MAIYDYARRFMQEHGNGNQWINGYPSEELISNEIKASHSFVCENEQGELVAKADFWFRIMIVLRSVRYGINQTFTLKR